MNKIVSYIKNYFRGIETGPLLFSILAITFLSVEPSFAQTFTGVNAFLTTITAAITGPIGKSVALLGVMAIGFTFMTGRMDWTFAVAILVGIAIIFGAATFVGSIVVR